MHGLPLITTLAVALTAAWLLGLITQRLRMSPIVGYLLAGVMIGPYTPGYVGDAGLAQQLAEVGVILLMFGVGLHFHLKDLLAVKSIAIPGAIGQCLFATLTALGVFWALGYSLPAAAVIGVAMAVASTVVLMRVLSDANALDTPAGHVAVGWLIVEDVLTVVVLVLIPLFGDAERGAGQPAGGVLSTVLLALGKLAALTAIVLLAGSRLIPWVMVRVAALRSRELFTLTVLVFSIAIAAGAYSFFGTSMALGAFLAGMVVAQSPVSHQAAADALPLRDAFAVLFFVAVGMQFDPGFLLKEPVTILAALAIILLCKPLVAIGIVALLGHSLRTALTVAFGLAQVGEFSFIVSETARAHSLLPASGHHVLVAAAILSIMINPLLFRLVAPAEAWIRRRPWLWRLLNAAAERRGRDLNQDATQRVEIATLDKARLAIIVGFGPVGRSVHGLLNDAGLATVVIDLNLDAVALLQARGEAAIYGDAARETILDLAGVRRASHVVVTLPHSADRVAIVAIARSMNPELRILVRARYLREREALLQVGVTAVVFEEAEAAIRLARLVLTDTGSQHADTLRKLRELRVQLARDAGTSLRPRSVRSVMVPWDRVQRISSGASRQEILQQATRQQFSRWPVLDAASGEVLGYVLAQDLTDSDAADPDWVHLLRPLPVAAPEQDVEATCLQMQAADSTICLVLEAGDPVGIVTLEDLL